MTDKIPDSLVISGHDYSLFRKDRPSGAVGGGVCALVNNKNCQCTMVQVPDDFFKVELLCFDLHCISVKYRFIVIYRPPYIDDDAVNYINSVCECIDLLSQVDASVIICGDFNFPDIAWTFDDSCLVAHANKCCYREFIDCVQRNSLTQFVNTPTNHKNILDLFFSNDQFSISDVSVTQPLSTRDHSIVEFGILDDRRSVHSPASYDYAKADWKGMIESLNSVDWCSIFDSYICGELWLAFHAVLKSHLEIFVPLVSNFNRSNKIHYPANIRKLISRKASAWR